MTTVLEKNRADLVLAINEHVERGDTKHIGGLMWAAGEASRLIEIDEWRPGTETEQTEDVQF